MLHFLMLGHVHAVALLATDAINAAHYSGIIICCPEQLGVCPAVLRVGCACRPVAITDALRDALCLDQDLLVLCWSSLKLQHTSWRFPILLMFV